MDPPVVPLPLQAKGHDEDAANARDHSQPAQAIMPEKQQQQQQQQQQPQPQPPSAAALDLESPLFDAAAALAAALQGAVVR